VVVNIWLKSYETEMTDRVETLLNPCLSPTVRVAAPGLKPDIAPSATIDDKENGMSALLTDEVF